MSVYRNVHVKQEGRTCFVCGGYGADYALHSKAREHGAFFPFLEQHKPPIGAERPGNDGVVSSCFVCYSFLLQQWDDFDRNSTPYSKRAYWLKRTDSGPFAGLDISSQPEFVAQYLGPPQCNSNYGGSSRSHTSSPVELVRPLPGVKNEYVEPGECSEMSVLKPPAKNEPSDAGILDLSVSSRPLSQPFQSSVSPGNAGYSCYLCGRKSSKPLLIMCADPTDNCPFFPNFYYFVKPPGAKPMDRGKVECCEKCHSVLISQWDVQQRAYVPLNKRRYDMMSIKLAAIEEKTGKNLEPKFVCFTCGYENVKSSRKEVNVHRTVQGEPCFRFLKWYMPAPGARSISKDGKVFLCSVCYKSLVRQYAVYQMESTPAEQRVYKIPNAYCSGRSVLREHLSGQQTQSQESCVLCEKVAGSLILVDTQPQGTKMFFPFLKDHDRPRTSNQTDHIGRVPLCSACYNNLTSQWEAFEASQVPHSQRNYSYSAPKHSSNNHSSALHVQISSPEDQVQSDQQANHEPLLTTVTAVPHPSVIATTSSEHSAKVTQHRPHSTKEVGEVQSSEERNVPRVYNPLELSIAMNPVLVATTCFICSEYSPPGFTYYIAAFPSGGNSNSTEEWQTCSPFFPFLTKHLPSSNAERLSEDGNTMVCAFCFHSLQAQWLAYETSPHAEDGNRWQRKYNTHHYVCYICGITTYRKRVRSITVKDFPFLVEHPRPPGALALQNGESVVTCLTCFESLMQQWKDYERIKLAVELRKYNWIVLPPPPEDENSRNAPSTSWETRPEGRNSNDASQNPSLPHGPKPPPLTMQAPCGGAAQKPLARTMTAASPLYPMGANSLVFSANNTPAFNAARTSSFAAALRKLAKQAVDPITEKDLSPITPVSSPALSQRSVTPKHGYLNNHQVASRAPTPPAPSPVHPGHHLERRKPMELSVLSSSNSRLMEPLSLKIEPSKVQSHHLHGDKRDDHLTGNKDLHMGGSLLQVRPTTTTSLARTEELHPSSRGFQPYRAVEDSRHQMGGAQPHVAHYEHPVPSPAYPYHPAFIPPHLPHPAYRFDDPLYLEHYGMMRPPMMHLPHPSVPFYRYPREVLNQPPVGFLSPGATAPTSAFSHDRLKMEERQREEQQEQREPEREVLRDGDAAVNQRDSPSASHLSRGSESPATRMGSITHGTPRDVVVRKCLATPPSPPSGPLNLATHPPPNQEVHRSRSQDVELWVARQAALENQHRPHSREYHEDGSSYKSHYVTPEPRRFEPDSQRGHPSKFWNERDRLPDGGIAAPIATSHGYNGLTVRGDDKLRVNPPQGIERQSVIAVDVRDKEHWGASSFLLRDGLNGRVTEKASCEDDVKTYEHAKKHSIFNGADGHAMQKVYEAPVRPTNSEPVPKVISKLDLEEDKLRKARLSGMYNSDESLSDNEEENEFKSCHFVIITKGPALKLDTNPKKMAVFSTLGLITQQKKREIELNKFLRRRRIFREPEKPLPVVENDSRHKLPWHLLLSSIVPNETPTKVSNTFSSKKLQYLESIGLKPMPTESREELERAWRVVIEDRARRHKIKLVLGEIQTSNGHSQSQQGTKRKTSDGTSYPNGMVVDSSRVPTPPKKSLAETEQHSDNVSLRIPTTPFKKDTPSPRANNPKLLPTQQEGERRVVVLSDSSTKDPHSRQLAREFAQEFHELVLQTTKQQLESNLPKSEDAELGTPVTSIPNAANANQTPSLILDSTVERSSYSWPGIEAILEAYQRHQAEQKLEKEVLQERCQFLQSNTCELDKEAERLSHNMSELLRLKRQLDEERQRHQSAIDNLKTYLREAR